jgi:aspartate/methionine/tyrosine aminotransferase
MPVPPDDAPRLSLAATGVRQSVFAALHGRIEAQRASGHRLIPLQIGDTHLAPPAEALSQAASAAELGVYGPVPGVPELRQVVADFRRGAGLRTAAGPANVHVGCGCTHALFCAVRAVVDPGDDVLVVSPFWPLFPGLLATAGGRMIEVPLTQRMYAEPTLDVGAILEAARTEATRAVYLITPNNPDGQVFGEDHLAAVADFARRHDLWVFSDEVYADFVYEGVHRSIANLPGMAERTITTFSLSKSHALAGARIGYVVAAPHVIDAARRISNHTVYNVPVAMQRVALAAIESGENWLVEAASHYRAARKATAEALAAIGIDTPQPSGGSFFFIDLADRLGDRSVTQLLERAIDEGVLLAPGDAFGVGFERHVRLCFTGVPATDVVDGVRRLGRALEALS